MRTSCREEARCDLKEALARTFKQGERKAVLVVGAGLHRRLIKALQDPSLGCADCSPLASWPRLMQELGRGFDTTMEHEDPTAAMEALVCHVSSCEETAASKAENKVLQQAAALLRKEVVSKYGNRGPSNLGQELTRTPFRDIISLNVDNSLDLCLMGAGWKPSTVEKTNNMPTWEALPFVYTSPCGKRHTRTWYPHGHVDRPAKIVLGQRRYGLQIAGAETGRKDFKAWEREFLDPKKPPSQAAYRERVDQMRGASASGTGPHKALSLMSLLMSSDLVFIGTSLDRAETDLWWCLHQRQRNVARQPHSRRPCTFYVTASCDCLSGVDAHLRTGPAGLTLVPFPTWDEAWRALFDTSCSCQRGSNA